MAQVKDTNFSSANTPHSAATSIPVAINPSCSHTPSSHAKPSSTLIHQANSHAKPVQHQCTIFKSSSSCRKHQHKRRNRWKKNKVLPWDLLLHRGTLGLVLANS
ncbi:unnamed protein product [Prunus brigantina]